MGWGGSVCDLYVDGRNGSCHGTTVLEFLPSLASSEMICWISAGQAIFLSVYLCGCMLCGGVVVPARTRLYLSTDRRSMGQAVSLTGQNEILGENLIDRSSLDRRLTFFMFLCSIGSFGHKRCLAGVNGRCFEHFLGCRTLCMHGLGIAGVAVLLISLALSPLPLSHPWTRGVRL